MKFRNILIKMNTGSRKRSCALTVFNRVNATAPCWFAVYLFPIWKLCQLCMNIKILVTKLSAGSK